MMKKEFSKRDIDMAYLAGILDGEGCIRVRNVVKNKLCLVVTVQQTDEEPLILFKAYFGGSLRRKSKLTTGGLQVFRYYASRRNAVRLLEQLSPYLIIKKSRAELGIKMSSIKLSHGGKDSRIGEKWKLAKQLVSLNSSKGGISKIITTPIPPS